MKETTLTLLFILFSVILVFAQDRQTINNQNLIVGDRIDGPANIRDTINGKILFSLNDSELIECTEMKNNWFIIGTYVKLESKHFEKFEIDKGDTLYNFDGEEIGIAVNNTPILLAHVRDGVDIGFIVGYTFYKNVKPETIIENELLKVIKRHNENITTKDLKFLIESFQMRKCSPNATSDKNGQWYCYGDNIIDDISPRDRITLIIENEILIGVVHSRNLDIRNKKTYELIRGHKFTPIANLTEEKVNNIIKERIKWYSSID